LGRDCARHRHSAIRVSIFVSAVAGGEKEFREAGQTRFAHPDHAVIDVIWLIEPAFNREHFHLSWMDIVAPIGIGGLWIGAFAWRLQTRAMVPLNDPQLEQALEQVHEH
jgi:hypothetical protein